MKKKVSSRTFFSHPAALLETELFLWTARGLSQKCSSTGSISLGHFVDWSLKHLHPKTQFLSDGQLYVTESLRSDQSLYMYGVRDVWGIPLQVSDHTQ